LFNTLVTKPKQNLPQEVEIRRAPKMAPWAITGAVLGAIGAFLIYLLIPTAQRTNENILGFLVLSFGSFGFGLALVLAIAVDLITSRKTKRALAERADQ
jgi:formate/nitrite transporter FocA (FNT family)